MKRIIKRLFKTHPNPLFQRGGRKDSSPERGGAEGGGVFRSIIILLSLAFPLVSSAQIMSSSNYRIPFDAGGGGGLRSTSTNYGVEDTVSESSSPTGVGLASTNYAACVGYQCLNETPFLTVTYAIQGTPCTNSSASSPPYNVALGTLSTAAVTTSADRICVRVSANASGGVAVKGRSANNSLKSVSTPADLIASATATLSAWTTGYGFCSSQAISGFSAVAPYNGTCDTGSGHVVGGMALTDQQIWTATGPVSNAYGELLTKASISTTVPAHNDYQDTLTITVTGTY